MIAVELCTSKSGVLWPSEYYKELIDSLSRGGSKNDPREKYVDLQSVLGKHIEKRTGRYFSTTGSALSKGDDCRLAVFSVRRVPEGQEQLRIGRAQLPDTKQWRRFEFEYFGTIGSSKYEAQSRLNRELLRSRSDEFFDPSSNSLALSFQLSKRRNDRDIDNLVDPLIPLFNKVIGPAYLLAIKERSSPFPTEHLCLTQEKVSLAIV